MKPLPQLLSYLCLLVFLVSLAGISRAEDDYFARRQQLDSAYAEKLQSLAARCDELGLREEAALTRGWSIPRYRGRQYLFLLEPKNPTTPAKDASDTIIKWHAKFMGHRQAQSAALFDLAKAEVEANRAARAYVLLHEVLREDEGHAEARRILGYRKGTSGAWSLTGTTSPPTKGTRTHAKYQWPAGKYWRHETPHYSIATDTSPKQAIEVGQKLEELHALWRQAFFSFWTNQPALKHRFDGGTQPLVREPKKLDVVLFKDREEYLAQLLPAEPKIGLTTGIYLDQLQTVFLYAGDEKQIPTWYHEATHQLFQEIDRFAERPGERQNFWMVEGAALYMESLQRHERGAGNSFWTIGGWDADRLQFARYRALSGDFLRPLGAISPLGRKAIQESPDIRKIYGQAAGMTHYLMDAQDGHYRDAAISFLRVVYEQRVQADTLGKILGASLEELDRDYHGFLQVTDTELGQIVSPERVRNLSLGRTAVTDKGLAHLATCKNLEWLDLSLTKTSDAGFAAVKDLPSLTQLFLEGTKISDESLKLIGQMKDLEELDLSAVPISDSGLASLAGLKKLRILYLTNSPISDAGLAHMKGLTSLETLETGGTKVTPAGLTELQKALPKLNRTK